MLHPPPMKGIRPAPLASLVADVRMERILPDVSPPWPTFNPSIATDSGGFSMIVRSQNVRYQYGRVLCDEQPRSINYLVKLDSAFGVSSVDPIDDDPGDLRRHQAPYLGFEDLRLIQVKGRWFAVGDSWELGPYGGPEMALLELDGAKVTRVNRLVGPVAGRAEKNWMPFVHADELHFIYRFGPLIVFRCDRRTGRLKWAGL